MSNTDATRPFELQAADRRTVRTKLGPNLSVPIVGGYGGLNRCGKHMRKDDTRQRRQRDRKVIHDAKYLTDKEAVDAPPIRADRRSLRVL